MEAEALARIYPGSSVPALEGVDLAVPGGSSLCVVGASGSGKTTLLRLIAGLEDPDRGEVRIDGVPVGRIPPGKRGISLLFQEASLYPGLTVWDNLAICLDLRRRRSGPAREAALAMARKFGLGRRLEALPDQLSRGEQQRVALGRAMLRRPGLLLLDEPLASLDPEMRFHLRLEIARLQEETGATMVHVTHDPFEAFTLGDRVAVLHQGRLQQLDSPEGIRTRPANRHVAAFASFPPMNFLQGRRKGSAWEGGGISLDLQPPVPDRAPVVAGIPPRSLRVGTGGSSPGIRASVLRSEALGEQGIVYLEASGRMLVSLLERLPLPRRGDILPLRIEPDGILWFDAESGSLAGGPVPGAGS